MDDQAFDMPLVRGLGQVVGVGQDGTDLGGAAGSSTDGGDGLVSGGAEGGTESSNLLGPDGSDPTYSGSDATGGGGGGGSSGGSSGGGSSGGGGSSAASSTGTSALSSLTSGNTPLIIGAVAVVAGIAGIAYLANRKHVQGGGAKGHAHRTLFHHSSHRSSARRSSRSR